MAMHLLNRILLGSVCALFAAAPLAAQPPLAPGGTLRAAFLGDNPSLGRVDRATGTVTGPVAEMVKELARRMGVPYKLIPVPNARVVAESVLNGSADMGFMAYNAGRAKEVDFSEPWLLMPNTYLVRADSAIQKVDDADQAGVTIIAAKNDTQDVYLSAHLKNTSVTPVPKVPENEEVKSLLAEKKIDALAANRQRLFEINGDDARFRIVSDDFYVAGQAIAITKGDAARIASLNKLVEEILNTDTVKKAIDGAGLRGVYPAKSKGR
jgi:polar amino acid transport system substrate-binding protein